MQQNFAAFFLYQRCYFFNKKVLLKTTIQASSDAVNEPVNIFCKIKSTKMNTIKKLFVVAIAAMFSNVSMAQKEKTVMVGGAEMYPSKNIVQNAVNSKDHTTLVAAVKAAGLVETLQGAGPFTVFAPTNAAFGLLPAGTVETLVKPESKAALTGILTYHVVAGNVSSKELVKMIKAGKGTAVLTTVAGGKLTATTEGKNVVLTDESGSRAIVTIPDVNQSNGVIHVIDHVLLPKM